MHLLLIKGLILRNVKQNEKFLDLDPNHPQNLISCFLSLPVNPVNCMNIYPERQTDRKKLSHKLRLVGGGDKKLSFG